MKRSLATAFAVILTAATALAADVGGAAFGAGVTLKQPTAVSRLLANPDEYLGKKVRVDGVVSAVCEHRGCWMQVTEPGSDQSIRIKVEDGVIVFPASAVGKRASAEGIFEAIPINPPATVSHDVHVQGAGPEHEAQCAGEAVGERIFLIRGTGAVVSE